MRGNPVGRGEERRACRPSGPSRTTTAPTDRRRAAGGGHPQAPTWRWPSGLSAAGWIGWGKPRGSRKRTGSGRSPAGPGGAARIGGAQAAPAGAPAAGGGAGHRGAAAPGRVGGDRSGGWRPTRAWGKLPGADTPGGTAGADAGIPAGRVGRPERTGPLQGLEASSLRRQLQERAKKFLGALPRNPGEARESLAAFVESMAFEPFGERRARRLRFHGVGHYGPLLTAICGTCSCLRRDSNAFVHRFSRGPAAAKAVRP